MEEMKITLNHAITVLTILRLSIFESDTNDNKQGVVQFWVTGLKTSGFGHGRQLFKRRMNTSPDSQLGEAWPT